METQTISKSIGQMENLETQLKEFRKKYRKRAKQEYVEQEREPVRFGGKSNCKRCYGRGYTDMIPIGERALQRFDCPCIAGLVEIYREATGQ